MQYVKKYMHLSMNKSCEAVEGAELKQYQLCSVETGLGQEKREGWKRLRGDTH